MKLIDDLILSTQELAKAAKDLRSDYNSNGRPNGTGHYYHKISLVYLCGLLFIMCIFNTCVPYPPIVYGILDISGKRLTTVNKDINSYEKLISNGSILYIEFTQLGNRFYYQISISLYTLNEYSVFKIHTLEFEFEGQKKIIKMNNTINLNQTPRLFVVNDNNELSVNAFFNYLYRDHNSIKLYLQNVFKKKDKDIGNAFDLNLKVNYSLDNETILTQEIKYLVSIIKGSPDIPDWIHWLFPGI